MIRHAFVRRRPGSLERLSIVTLTILFSACTQSPDGQPPVYPVKGTVLYKGKPITGGVVVFELDGGGASTGATGARAPLRATGRIEPDGSFRLMAFPGSEGVPEGNYKVGISSMPPRTEGNLFNEPRMS